ncbi:MAG TPA: isoprenylcysteine carboxylmethyltransferase family protein [Candidatus Angelobacter sp.]
MVIWLNAFSRRILAESFKISIVRVIASSFITRLQIQAGLSSERASEITNYLWVVLAIIWLIGAITAKRTERGQSSGSRVTHLIPEVLAFFLLFARDPERHWPHWLHRGFIPEQSAALTWTGLALTAIGIAFAIWARLWIGSNWSGRITIKQDHQLIQNGPYAIVRHPIYSGVLLGFLGTALIHGELGGLLGLAFAIFGWSLKLHQEEAFMVQQFGSVYMDYKQRVKALVPLWSKRPRVDEC